jgi:hypothetical protein
MHDKPKIIDLYLLGAPFDVAVGVHRAWDRLSVDERGTWHDLTADERRTVLLAIAARRRAGTLH